MIDELFFLPFLLHFLDFLDVLVGKCFFDFLDVLVGAIKWFKWIFQRLGANFRWIFSFFGWNQRKLQQMSTEENFGSLVGRRIKRRRKTMKGGWGRWSHRVKTPNDSYLWAVLSPYLVSFTFGALCFVFRCCAVGVSFCTFDFNSLIPIWSWMWMR